MKQDNKVISFLAIGGIMLGTLAVNFLQLEISTGNVNIIDLKYIVLGIFTIGFFNLIIAMILQSFYLGNLISSLFYSIIAIANYYVIQFRGMPITTQDILNVRTALEVGGAYTFCISLRVCMIVILSVLTIICSLFIKKIESGLKDIKKEKKVVMGSLFIMTLIYIYFSYFSRNPVKPENVLRLSWTEGYYEYGYILCSFEILCKSINPIKEPQGYDFKIVEEIAEQYNEEIEGEKTPDIILILNESFYDLNLITDLDTDIDVSMPIDSYNIIHGYCSVQVSGGGTSISEYELLTSNSMHLLQGITPFNSLEFSDANSIVKYLKSLGYYTLGAHSESKVNYSRGRVYPKLGFDMIKFEESFNNVQYYASRKPENGAMNLATDSSSYKNLIKWYEEMPVGPRFCYMLTMQNHSPYNLLEADDLLVHDKRGHGQYDAEIDEYLSCIYQSYQAFAELIEYFEQSDRDVIICMVGDHAPYFVLDIVDRKDLDEIKRDVNLCLTPFMIWSNYDLESKNFSPCSMIYLVPILLREAGVSMSPYYNFMLDMKNEAPILTQLDHYFDEDGNMLPYQTENQYTSDKIQSYFYAEYNNIRGTRNRINTVFESQN